MLEAQRVPEAEGELEPLVLLDRVALAEPVPEAQELTEKLTVTLPEALGDVEAPLLLEPELVALLHREILLLTLPEGLKLAVCLPEVEEDTLGVPQEETVSDLVMEELLLLLWLGAPERLPDREGAGEPVRVPDADGRTEPLSTALLLPSREEEKAPEAVMEATEPRPLLLPDLLPESVTLPVTEAEKVGEPVRVTLREPVTD